MSQGVLVRVGVPQWHPAAWYAGPESLCVYTRDGVRKILRDGNLGAVIRDLTDVTIERVTDVTELTDEDHRRLALWSM